MADLIDLASIRRVRPRHPAADGPLPPLNVSVPSGVNEVDWNWSLP